MNLCAKTEYACLAVLELAFHYGSGDPVRIRDLAQRHGIPSQFLVQILLQLKAAGLIKSIRGASGGYVLVRDPAELTLSEVMSIVDGSSEEVATSAGKATSASRVLLRAWQAAAAAQRSILEGVTVADLVEQAAGEPEPMYYI